ncbi:hypothetical protein [Hymenobacter koreensis]|uniref:Uncharacterized protein n=1 Tax=Hymenobacter koreensis TaxID=1084523 RepID=A0ABP8J546_9BACT
MIRVIVGFLLLVMGCGTEAQQQKTAQPPVLRPSAEEIRVYNDLLNELVEERLYNRYLGAHERRISKAYAAAFYEKTDTTGLQQEIDSLRNNIIQQRTKACIVYLDTVFRPFIEPWKFYESAKVVSMIKWVTTDAQTAVSTLSTGMPGLQSEAFQLRAAQIKPAQAYKKGAIGECFIGKVSVSKLVFNSDYTRCLLAYNFYCGDRCGRGELVSAEKRNGRWVIVQAEECWIA